MTTEMTPSPIRGVWIDTDPAVGEPGRDVDDGYAILQALRSPELAVVGVSTVFGNTTRPNGDRIAAQLLRLADATDVPLHSGADSAEHRDPTAASAALAETLAQMPLTILALGPLTNIATTLRQRPELSSRIQKLVFVGGRRPGQRFMVGDHGPLPDFNFESDPVACEEILSYPFALVLAGFEVSTHATLTQAHLDRLAEGPPAARWLAERSHGWLRWWAEHLHHDGFHPFDTLAVAAVSTPELIAVEALTVSLAQVQRDPPADIELHAAADLPGGRPVSYAARAHPGFVDDLIRRITTG